MIKKFIDELKMTLGFYSYNDFLKLIYIKNGYFDLNLIKIKFQNLECFFI